MGTAAGLQNVAKAFEDIIGQYRLFGIFGRNAIRHTVGDLKIEKSFLNIKVIDY